MSDAETSYKHADAQIQRLRANGGTILDLADDDYVGLTRLPASIAQLTALTKLNLDNTQVSDLAPIAQLTALTKLSLVNTQVRDLAPIAQLTALTKLNLDNTQVSDLTPIAQLTALTELDFYNTQVSDLGPIAQLTALTKLNFDYTQVSDLSPIAQLTALTGLNFDYTQVSDLGPIAQLTALTELDFDETLVSDLGPIAQLTDLKWLSLNGTLVNDLGPIAQLTALTTLFLDSTQFSDPGPIAQLTNLRRLSLSGTQISDLSPIAQLTALTTLFLNGTQISDLGPIAQLTTLTELNIGSTQVSDLGPIAQLTALTKLNFDYTQVNDLGPIAQLTALTTLFLDSTQFSDPGPIAQLTNLRRLSLSGTQISDLGPIAQLTTLTELNIGSTQVSDLGPIAQLTALTKLNFDYTQVSDLGPIAQLTALTKLNLDNTQVSDLGPLTTLRELTKTSSLEGLSFKKTVATRFDLRIAKIAEITNPKERAAKLFSYLEGSEPPVQLDENGPAPSPLLDVNYANDRLEIADSHPSEAERDDQLKEVLHTRLKARNIDLERLAGNQFFVLCAKARSLTTRLDSNFDELDMLNIHLDVEELARLRDRGAERDGDEAFPQEVADALADVVSIGPGLTLDNKAVELLEDRKRRFVANAPTASQQAAHDGFSIALAQDDAAIGDRLRTLETQVLEREDDSAGAAIQDSTHRNILIKVGRLALAGVAIVATDVATPFISEPVKAFLMTKWPLVAEVAALYGPSFQTWFLSAMSGLNEFAGLAANTQARAIERPVKPEEDTD